MTKSSLAGGLATFSLLVLAASFAPACRKAEPEEIVNFNAAAGTGGFPFYPPPTGGSPSSNSGGAPGTGAAPEDPDGGDGSAAGGAGGTPDPALCDVPEPVVGGEFSKARLIEAAAACGRAHYCRFLATAETLRDATALFAADRSDENRNSAQGAFRTAMESWEEAALFAFGPAAGDRSPGGENLATLIYVYPNFARCSVDQQLLSRFYATPAFGGGSLIGARTLAAVEYLLFYPGTDHGCAYPTQISSAQWTALGEDELSKRKAEYAAAASEDVFRTATDLVNAWDPAHGNFLQEFVDAGRGSDLFAHDQDALQAVNEALFYLELDAKDAKLGIPLGINEACSSGFCPDRFESLYAFGGTEHLRTNLRAFRRLFEGCGEDFAGIGFDDWLRSAGAGALADEMLRALDNAQAAADALGSPPISDLEGARTLYEALRVFATLLKADFVTALNLDRPITSGTDND